MKEIHSERDDLLKIFLADLSQPKDEDHEIIVGCVPKYSCKNRFIQKIMIKLFGYKVLTKMVKSKKWVVKTEDFPDCFDGTVTLKMNDI